LISDQIITDVKTLAPALAVLAAVLRVIPALIVSGRTRKRGRNPSHATIRVQTLSSAAPWSRYKEAWPAGWDKVETRHRYRRRERIWIWFFALVFLVAAGYYGVLLFDDVVSDVITSRNGTGFLAAPACILFATLCVFQLRFLTKIRGERGLAETLYGADGSVTVTGELAEIRQYCLGALYESGSTIVSCSEEQDEKGQYLEIVAATGIWPPQWLNTGPLQLVSFRGQKVVVQVRQATGTEWDVSVRSDNMDPGVDEGHKANLRNARSFVEAWTFFPGSAED
jgi:hypothetical protein